MDERLLVQRHIDGHNYAAQDQAVRCLRHVDCRKGETYITANRRMCLETLQSVTATIGISHINDQTLMLRTMFWRVEALRGNREAQSIAYACEIEERRRFQTGSMADYPPLFSEFLPPWWKFW